MVEGWVRDPGIKLTGCSEKGGGRGDWYFLFVCQIDPLKNSVLNNYFLFLRLRNTIKPSFSKLHLATSHCFSLILEALTQHFKNEF